MLARLLITCIDWLTLAANPPVVVSQRVVLRVGVEEDLGVAMLHGDGIVVPDLCLWREENVRSLRLSHTYPDC